MNDTDKQKRVADRWWEAQRQTAAEAPMALQQNDLNKICRVMAKAIYESYEHFKCWFPEHMEEEVIGELAKAIRDHTILPEMVGLLGRFVIYYRLMEEEGKNIRLFENLIGRADAILKDTILKKEGVRNDDGTIS